MSAISHANRRLLTLTPLKKLSSNQIQRNYASMSAWRINDSLDNRFDVDLRSKLTCMETRVPTISSPADVLVKVNSTSVNPLDVRMCYGYGRRVLDILSMLTDHEPKITNDRYPLTLGRDFSGEVVACGPNTRNFKPGDIVFGAVEPQRSGAHAEYVTVPDYCITKKPKNLTHQQAASIPFVALTAYSALCTFGGLSRNSCTGRSVLVLGGSGGVGTFAIQLLKFWGASVTATCSEEKIQWLENSLLVDQAICYQDISQLESVKGKFDFVLDCGDYEKTSKERHEIVSDGAQFLKPYSQSVYVTLSPSILSNTDKHGLVLGTSRTAIEAITDTLTGLRNLNSARWAVFLPNKSALDYVSSLYEDEVITAQLHSTFSFDRMADAYEELDSGRARGKVIVDVTSRSGGGETTSEQTTAI